MKTIKRVVYGFWVVACVISMFSWLHSLLLAANHLAWFEKIKISSIVYQQSVITLAILLLLPLIILTVVRKI